MVSKQVMVWIVAGACLIGAWLAGGPSVAAQDAVSNFEWELISADAGGYAGGSGYGGPVHGRVFLYNKTTGKTYRFWPDCGDDYPNGCFDSLPMLEGAGISGIQLPGKARWPAHFRGVTF